MPAFDVTATPASLTLKGGETGTFVVTATSRMTRRVTARAELAVAPDTLASWVKPVGETQKTFAAANATEKFTWEVTVPAGQAATSLTCTPSVVDVEAPEDNYGLGSAIAITVTAEAVKPLPPPPPFPKWIIPVVALVLIAAGVGVWLMLRDGGGGMPDLVGKQLDSAKASLAKSPIVVVAQDSLSSAADTVRFPAGAVMAQSPAAGTELKGSKDAPDTARLVVQKNFTVVPPNLVGSTPVDVASRLGLAGLAARSRGVIVRDAADMGKVRSTTPASGALAVVGDTVTIGVGARLCRPGVLCPFKPTMTAEMEAAITTANRDKLGPVLQKRLKPPGQD